MLSPGLLVIHYTSRGGQDDVPKLTSRKELGDPLLKLSKADVVSGADNTSLVEAAVELDNDLSGAVVINLLELANVAWKGGRLVCGRGLNVEHHEGKNPRTCKILAQYGGTVDISAT